MQPAQLKIRLYGDAILTQKSLPVKEIGPAERLLIESMLYTMYQHKGIGLAAPQVGIDQRIFVADINGQKHTVDLENLLARVFLHETDHLDGKWIVDYVSAKEKKELIKEFEAFLRKEIGGQS